VLSTLRDRLRSGDIFVTGSRKYASLDTYLISSQKWPELKPEILRQLSSGDKTLHRLDERIKELEAYLPLMESILHEGGDIRLDDNGELVVTPLEAADLPATVEGLNQSIKACIPEVDLPEILMEVDGWTNFSTHLQGLENEPRGAGHQALLLAALLAGACNIPLADMARSTGLDYQALWWVSNIICVKKRSRRLIINWLIFTTNNGSLRSGAAACSPPRMVSASL